MEGGAVEYSILIDPTEGRYIFGTTATVTCEDGFRGGGDITCERSGNWTSSELPTCESESVGKTCEYITHKNRELYIHGKPIVSKYIPCYER